MTAAEAVAEALASIEGNLGKFQGGRDGADTGGHYRGYMAEAHELIRRIELRGWKLTDLRTLP